MANIRIPGLIARTATSGIVHWYWYPSATLKRAGWMPLKLGTDQGAAIAAAQARNAEVAAWRSGGATPKQIARFARRATLAALIKRYRADRLPQLAATTQKTYGTALNRLEAWAGNEPAAAITRRNVRTLRDAMTAPRSTVGYHAAHATLRTGRALYEWAKGHADGLGTNPFAEFDLAAPAPRD